MSIPGYVTGSTDELIKMILENFFDFWGNHGRFSEAASKLIEDGQLAAVFFCESSGQILGTAFWNKDICRIAGSIIRIISRIT